MSQENVEALMLLLEQLFDARRVDPEHLAEDVEWVNPPEAVEPGTRRGVDAFNRAIASVFDTWDDVRFDPERVIENGDDVIVLGMMHGHIHGPGMEVNSPHGEIWSFRDGLVTRMRWVNTYAEALEAAGVRE
jgi:ketosteroid isomerase-like protein